jgi:hypothetical protein
MEEVSMATFCEGLMAWGHITIPKIMRKAPKRTKYSTAT